MPLREIDPLNLYLSNYGYENQNLPVGSMKKIREYAKQKYNRNFTNIQQLAKFLKTDTIQAQRNLVKEYNVNLLKQREEKKIQKQKEDKQRLITEARENNALIFKNKKRSELIKKIYKQIELINKDKINKFKIDLNEVFSYFNFNEFLNKLLNMLGEINHQYLTLGINENYYTLGDNTRLKLLENITNDLIQTEELTESDGSLIQNIEQADEIEIKVFEPTFKNKKSYGAFFKYNHKLNIDLTKYGIFKNEDYNNIDMIKNINKENCLIYALKIGGLEDEKIEILKYFVKNRNIPLCDIEKLCDKVEIKIILNKLNKHNKKDDKHNERYIYGKKYDRTFHIGLIEEHYFIIDKTDITTYAVKNFNDIKDKKDFNYIVECYNGKYKRDKTSCIDSFKLIKLLIDYKDVLLEKITNENSLICATQFYDKMEEEIIYLDFDDKAVKPVVEEKKEKKDDKFINIFFDFETYTKLINNKKQHIPYLCRTIDNNNKEQVFYGEDCGLKMLFSLKQNTRLIAHNANYDYRFILKHLYNVSEISRGNRLISCSGLFKKLKIQIKDSYHLISMPLRNFPDAFKINSIKEVMPYDLYTEENLNKIYVPIKDALTYVKEKDKIQFLENIKKWNLQKEESYNIIEYSSQYCKLDCSILKDGYNIFKGWILEHTQIDIDEILTIASLAHLYFINKGCYDGVYQLGNTPQRFIQKCVVGGRTMCCNNEKHKINGKIQDFDAVSLYPSAMYRMDGFLKGKPKIITNLDYNDLKNKDGYFVEIIIKNVGIKRDFSLMSFKNDKGVRIFSNDLIGKNLFVDKTTLEDIINFQNVEFDIVRGYYFNNGFNTKIKDTIKYLFNKRLELKKQNNNCEMVYKLIMNSGYGKSIMKPVEQETKIINNEKEFNTYLSRNYNWITSFNRINDSEKFRVKTVKTLIDHFNIAHIGVSILSMSKRIMNEVMTLAEDNKLKIFYQDTDSMHLYEKDINILENKFKEKYNRELIGKSLGQFHSDFDFVDKEGNKRNDIKNIYASKSIFLGKKCYIDELKGQNKITGEIETDYHIRMKGVPNSCILYTSQKLGYKNVFDMYEDLYKGMTINFDLTQDGKKANFKFENDYTINTLSLFNRAIKF